MKDKKQIITIKRCSRCNSAILIDADTGLCWLCKKRAELSFELVYIQVAKETQ